MASSDDVSFIAGYLLGYALAPVLLIAAVGIYAAASAVLNACVRFYINH